jgi:hypothetical protein
LPQGTPALNRENHHLLPRIEVEINLIGPASHQHKLGMLRAN